MVAQKNMATLFFAGILLCAIRVDAMEVKKYSMRHMPSGLHTDFESLSLGFDYDKHTDVLEDVCCGVVNEDRAYEADDEKEGDSAEQDKISLGVMTKVGKVLIFLVPHITKILHVKK